MTNDKIEQLKDQLIQLNWRELRLLKKAFRDRSNDNGINLIKQVMRTKGKLEQAKKETKPNEKPKTSRCFFCNCELSFFEPIGYAYCDKCKSYLATAPSEELEELMNHYSEISIVLSTIVECQKHNIN